MPDSAELDMFLPLLPQGGDPMAGAGEMLFPDLGDGEDGCMITSVPGLTEVGCIHLCCKHCKWPGPQHRIDAVPPYPSLLNQS